MKWIQAKTDKQLTLNGIRIEVEHRDKAIFAITLTDDHGASIKLSKNGSYGVDVLVPAPPEMHKIPVLTGKVAGGTIPVRLKFEHKFQADARKRELEATGGEDMKVEEVEVPDDDAPINAPDDGIPF